MLYNEDDETERDSGGRSAVGEFLMTNYQFHVNIININENLPNILDSRYRNFHKSVYVSSRCCTDIWEMFVAFWRKITNRSLSLSEFSKDA